MAQPKEAFISTIVSKMPHADNSQLERFYDYHALRGCPPLFLDKVSHTFRYISKPEIAQVAAITAEQLNGTLDDDYHVYFDRARSSMRWAYEKLLQGGLKSASVLFNGCGLGELIYEPWEDILYQDPQPLVVPDDWSIGAEQMTDMADSLQYKRKHLYLVPFFASKNAIAKIVAVQSPHTQIISLGRPLETFDEIFDQEDYDYMEALHSASRGTLEHFDQDMFKQFTLVTSHHFTPDNFPGILLGKRRLNGEPIPGLIRPARPNYRRATYAKTLHGKQSQLRPSPSQVTLTV